MAEQVNLRNLVLDILIEVTREKEFSHIAVRNVLDKYRYLPRQDRAFIKRLSEGTLERMIEMDYIIDQFSRTKVRKMKPVIAAILRSGVYQLKYMDSVPASAACNEAVKLAAKRGFSQLKGFVNGVMRSIARNIDSISWPSKETDPVGALSVKYSMPEWLTSRYLSRFGAGKTERILAAYLAKQDTCVRVNTLRITPEELTERLRRQGIRVIPDDRLPYALHISGYDTLYDLEEFEDGLLYIQDISSMMAVGTADLPQGAFVLDVCAAPGGKSIHAAQLLQGTGKVEARDLTPYKVSMIEENMERCRVTNMRAVVWDALQDDPSMHDRADVVIADLPCSGLGVIGSKPDIKYNVTPEKIRELAALQQRILEVVCSYVKPGGRLIYSTCTITGEENQQNVRTFLERHPGFSLDTEQEFFPDEGCDGFYIAGMIRKIHE